VFVYNGFGRLDQPSPNQLLTKAIGLQLGSAPAGWHRLLSGAYGRDIAWLIPAALIALAFSLVIGRRSGRRDDLLRADGVLWGTWLVVLLVVFSASSTINAYYTAALSPAIAALLGIGVALAWEHRAERSARLAVAATIAVTCAYAVWLLPGNGVGLVGGLTVIIAGLGLAAIVAVLLAPARRWTLALAAVAVLAVPAAASISVVAKGFGPFDTPFESAASSTLARELGAVAKQTAALLPPLERANRGERDLMATQTAAVAAPFIYDSGQEVLPIGGFTGTIPEPTLGAEAARPDLGAEAARPDLGAEAARPALGAGACDDQRVALPALIAARSGAGPRHQTEVPDGPLNGPTRSAVIQPP
jgi:4-amino-4-deoxy-L-arabinose transferase-like glycosyltransferase